MKRFLLLLLAFAAGPLLRAANPVPYTEGVGFSFRLPQGYATMTIYDETGGNPDEYLAASGTLEESGVTIAWLRPGAKYHLNFTGNHLSEYWMSFTVPQGYRLIVDNMERDLVHITAPNNDSFIIHDCHIQLLPSLDPNSPAPFGSFSGIQIGKSISWEIGLGGIQLDRSAGRIGFKEYDLTNGPTARDRLFLATTQYNAGEVWAIKDGTLDQRLRQVIAPQGVVDILDDGSGGYNFRFFPHSQSEGSPGNPNILHGSPWKTIHVEAPATNQLKITETEGAATRVSLLTLSSSSGTVPSGNYIWTLQEGDASNWLRTTTHTSTQSGGGPRDDVVVVRTVKPDTSTTDVSATKYHYVNHAWGEEVTQIVADPDGAALTTTLEYYFNSGDRGDYRKLRSRTDPTGNWTAYDYYDDWEQRGQLKYECHPNGNSPATVPATLGTSAGRAFYYSTYAADWTGRHVRPILRQEWATEEGANSVRVGQTVWGIGDNYPANDFPHEYAFTMTYNDEIHYRQDYFEHWRADAYPSMADRPYLRTDADGAQTSWSYGAGSFNAETGEFTAGTSISHGRHLTIHGSSNSSGAESISSWGGQTFPEIHLIPKKSTMEASIYQNGLVYRTETWVYNGSGDFKPLTWTKFAYDDQGRLKHITSSNGAESDNTYTDGRLTETTAPDGVVTQYTYDSLGRVATTTKVHAPLSGIHKAQADVTTTYGYDGADHVVSEIISDAAKTDTIVTGRAYDLAGRPKSSTPPGVGDTTTTFEYFPATRTQKSTAPDGGETVRETYLDGRLKSVTGSAVVAAHYTYGAEIDGRQFTKVNVGSSTSTRFQKSWTDWMGRAVKLVKPSFSKSNQADFVEERSYDLLTGQLVKVTRTGQAPTLYKYNTYGALVRSGLDVDSSDSLVPASNDRITDVDTSFEPSGDTWWLKTTSTIHPTVEPDVPVIASIKRTRLKGFADGVQAEEQDTDIEGNTVTTLTTVSGRLVTNRTTVPGITAGDRYVYTYNGRASATTDYDGLTTKITYDSLGRQASVTDPRELATTTAYYAGTALPSTVTDAASVVVSTFAYDTSGRTAWTKDAADKYTRYAYNTRGQVTNVWGNATYPISYEYDPTYGDQTGMSTYRGAPAGDFENLDSWSSVGVADTTTWSYDIPTGLLWKKSDAAGHFVTLDYDSAGRIAKRTLARGVYAGFEYDPATGELLKQTYSDDTPGVIYAYTRLGQTDTVKDYTGTWDYAYDADKPWRGASTVLPAFYGTRTATALYESSGIIGRYLGFQLGSDVNSNADVEQRYVYSSDGRFDQLVTQRASNSVSRTFDYSYTEKTPFVSGLTVTGGHPFSVSRSYATSRDLLEKIDSQWSGASVARFDYTYDDRYQRTTAKQRGAAFADYWTGTTYSAVFNKYTYNARSELETSAMYGGDTPSVTPASADELPGRRFEYRFDSIGNRKTAGQDGTVGGADDKYTANKLNQYDDKENNTVRVLGTAKANAVVAVAGAPGGTNKKDRAWGADVVPSNASTAVKGTVNVYAALIGGGADLIRSTSKSFFIPRGLQAFGYDDDGNLTRDGVWDYEYDAENRLISAQNRTEVIGAGMIAVADARRLEFRYDYLGRRVRKTVYGGWNGTVYAGAALSDTKYLYDGWNLVAEFTVGTGGSLTLAKTYTWGLDLAGSLNASGGVGALLEIRDELQNKTLLPVYDGNGNVVVLLNADSGAFDATYEYDPFGNLLRAEGDYAQANAFRFSTKWQDNETNLVYYGLRYYSPTLGRFINKDPIEEQGGLNLYGFVGNNGVNRWDYLGMLDYVDRGEDGTITVGVNYYNDAGDNWVYYTGHGEEWLQQMEWSLAGAGGSGPDFEDFGTPRGMSGLAASIEMRQAANDFNFAQELAAREWVAQTNDALKQQADVAFWQQSTLGGRTPAGFGAPNNPADEIGTYLVRQDAKGTWNIVGKTNGVTTPNAYVNGINGDLNRHAQLGGIHLQEQLGKGMTEYTLFNNPSKGFFGDVFETAMDKLGFTSAPAKALAGVLQGVQSSGRSVNWIAHSQGGAIFAQAMSYAGGNLSANSVTFNAGANNAWVTNGIAKSVGVQVGYYYSPWDPVPNVIGGNGNPLTMVGSTLASPFLMTKMSQHTAPTSTWSPHP